MRAYWRPVQPIFDTRSLLEVVDCVQVAYGMISRQTIAALAQRGLLYILGVREQADRLVRDVVPSAPPEMRKVELKGSVGLAGGTG